MTRLLEAWATIVPWIIISALILLIGASAATP